MMVIIIVIIITMLVDMTRLFTAFKLCSESHVITDFCKSKLQQVHTQRVSHSDKVWKICSLR